MRLRTSFLVDGFNLYHSIRDIARFNDGILLKWLNIASLCKSFLHHIGNADLESMYYFSAFAHHLNDPSVVARHKTYLKCLEDNDVQKIMSRFKWKDIKCALFQSYTIRCAGCPGEFVKHEEKETDVAIAAKLFELLSMDSCDCIVLVTGDTDLAPAVLSAQSLYPNKKILFAFPYRRANAQLKQIAPDSFAIKVRSYRTHQFPNPYPMSDGTLVYKPSTW